MFKKIKEKVLGLFVKKEEIIKLGKNKCSSRIKRVMVEGDTRFYYRIPLGDFKVLSLASFLPEKEFNDFLNKRTISLKDSCGKTVRFKNSFYNTLISENEKKISFNKFLEVIMLEKRKDVLDQINKICKMSEEELVCYFDSVVKEKVANRDMGDKLVIFSSDIDYFDEPYSDEEKKEELSKEEATKMLNMLCDEGKKLSERVENYTNYLSTKKE